MGTHEDKGRAKWKIKSVRDAVLKLRFPATGLSIRFRIHERPDWPTSFSGRLAFNSQMKNTTTVPPMMTVRLEHCKINFVSDFQFCQRQWPLGYLCDIVSGPADQPECCNKQWRGIDEDTFVDIGNLTGLVCVHRIQVIQCDRGYSHSSIPHFAFVVVPFGAYTVQNCRKRQYPVVLLGDAGVRNAGIVIEKLFFLRSGLF